VITWILDSGQSIERRRCTCAVPNRIGEADRHFEMPGCNMAVFVHAVRILFLGAIIWAGANAPSLALEADASADPRGMAGWGEPFGRQPIAAPPYEMSARWAELNSRILSEEETLAACRSGEGTCPLAAQRFLHIVELGRQRQGRARLGEINRAVNLSIKPIRHLARYVTDDFWSAPIAALDAGAGDCKDYAIVKYVALRDSGIAADDLRFVIVRDVKLDTEHAVVAVRLDEEWLVLDNRTLIMANATDARHYNPLYVLDDRGVRAVATAALR
jgi:predicted transglutaminase-like cysteine proteinase